MDPELRKASSLAQSGRFEEAAALYRGLLGRAPDHPEATHFLGVCLVRSGRPGEGMPLLARAAQLAPGNALYLLNYGLFLAESGELAAAEQQFRSILQADPANAAAHNYLGMACQRLGRFDEAVAAYREALRLAPGDAGAANNFGFCLFERGEFEGALEWLQRSLAAAPGNAMAHANLGNVLRALGQPHAAAESYRRAIRLAPGFAEAHYNLALTLRELGELAGALAAARAAVRCAPQRAALWQMFADVLAASRFSAWDAGLAEDCERLFARSDAEVQGCAEAVLGLVRAGPRGGRLFVLLLEHALVPDAAFEAELVELRRELLQAPRSLELACALAQQCFMNEHLWPESAAESRRVERLLAGAQTPLDLATLAMYRPLAERRKPAGGGEAFERMWRRLVEEPRAEAALQRSVAAWTPIEDEVSRRVRAQYEEHPYPRWHRAPASAPFPLPRMLRSLFPHLRGLRIAEAPDVLIAGCGTGRHAAVTAQLQALGRVLAVDISRASLAHAMRRCAELGLRNVRFAQADILALRGREERFDLIECVGVLHHMYDPLEGWRALLSLLRPGGVMKIGLYSQLARRGIAAAAQLAHGLELREARRRIFALPAGHPARCVTRIPDFYCASGTRDLILHVQEQRFTVEGLERAIAALGLEFLGFEPDDKRVLARYRADYPGDPAATSFANWAAFEAAHPDTFGAMYQFWVRR